MVQEKKIGVLEGAIINDSYKKEPQQLIWALKYCALISLGHIILILKTSNTIEIIDTTLCKLVKIKHDTETINICLEK